jgi:uridine kinase
MNNPEFDIASEIIRNSSHSQVYLVGIDGLGGSGKSTLTERIHHQLEAAQLTVTIVHNDDFYLPATTRSKLSPQLKPVGADFDWVRLRDQVLVPLRSNQIADYVRYDWPSDRLAEHHKIRPHGIVLIEGVYSTRAELRDLYDYRVWVDCPSELRLSRGLARDSNVALSLWVDDWMPSEERYYNEHCPNTFAQVVVNSAAA